MDDLIRKYLLRTGHLALPGIGSFAIHQFSAKYDATQQLMIAPSTVILFSAETSLPAAEFYQYLSEELQIDTVEATKQFQLYVKELSDSLKQTNLLNLKGIGKLIVDTSGNMHFEYQHPVQPAQITVAYKQFKTQTTSVPPVELKISSESVEAESSEITIQSENIEDNTELEVDLSDEDLEEIESFNQKDNWYIYAILLGAIGVATIWYYYYTLLD